MFTCRNIPSSLSQGKCAQEAGSIATLHDNADSLSEKMVNISLFA